MRSVKDGVKEEVRSGAALVCDQYKLRDLQLNSREEKNI